MKLNKLLKCQWYEFLIYRIGLGEEDFLILPNLSKLPSFNLYAGSYFSSLPSVITFKAGFLIVLLVPPKEV